MKISIIVAATENNIIGRDNDLPWKLPNDMRFFKEKTTGHHILMGRKNYLSFNKLLPNRTNLILSRDPNYRVEGAYNFTKIEDAIKFAENNHETELMVIGGGNIYEQLLPYTDTIYLTRIHTNLEGDVFFPSLNMDTWKLTEEKYHNVDDNKHSFPFTFKTYIRK